MPGRSTNYKKGEEGAGGTEGKGRKREWGGNEGEERKKEWNVKG
jgi:hypothetical protein